ncbi:hypothetical protein CVT24_000931, partial [Panaeolus cyanescens]
MVFEFTPAHDHTSTSAGAGGLNRTPPTSITIEQRNSGWTDTLSTILRPAQVSPRAPPNLRAGSRRIRHDEPNDKTGPKSKHYHDTNGEPNTTANANAKQNANGDDEPIDWNASPHIHPLARKNTNPRSAQRHHSGAIWRHILSRAVFEDLKRLEDRCRLRERERERGEERERLRQGEKRKELEVEGRQVNSHGHMKNRRDSRFRYSTASTSMERRGRSRELGVGRQRKAKSTRMRGGYVDAKERRDFVKRTSAGAGSSDIQLELQLGACGTCLFEDICDVHRDIDIPAPLDSFLDHRPLGIVDPLPKLQTEASEGTNGPVIQVWHRFVRIECIGLSGVLLYELASAEYPPVLPGPQAFNHSRLDGTAAHPYTKQPMPSEYPLLTLESVFGDLTDPHSPSMHIDDLLDAVKAKVFYFPAYACTSFIAGQAMVAFLRNQPELRPVPCPDGFSVRYVPSVPSPTHTHNAQSWSLDQSFLEMDADPEVVPNPNPNPKPKAKAKRTTTTNSTTTKSTLNAGHHDPKRSSKSLSIDRNWVAPGPAPSSSNSSGWKNGTKTAPFLGHLSASAASGHGMSKSMTLDLELDDEDPYRTLMI